MKVLSLFDGMACGMLAMRSAGVEVDRYVAYEIDKYAVKTAQHNFPMIEEKGDVFTADFTEYQGFDFLIGGSPCTYWSIAQSNDKRETTASGLGWELFSQYLRALHEAKPKYFIYENNKSMSKAIRDSIREAFGFEEICINSALVSAQNRQRYYWVGKRNADGTYSKVDVQQPEDRGILLKDVLDNSNFTPAITTTEGKAHCLVASYYKGFGNNSIEYNAHHQQRAAIAEPVRIGCMPSPDGTLKNSQGMRVYSVEGKSVNMTAQGGGLGAKTGLYAVPVNTTAEGKAGTLRATCYKDGIRNLVANNIDRKTAVAESVTVLKAIPEIVRKYGYLPEMFNAYNRAEITNKAPTLSTGSMVTSSCAVNKLEPIKGWAIPTEWDENGIPIKARSGADGNEYTVYQVKDGQITIKGKTYPIKLIDGYWIIRKLTVSECKRLQTVPEWYDFSCVSNTQAYKMLGNGWTVEVIAHLIKACLE